MAQTADSFSYLNTLSHLWNRAEDDLGDIEDLHRDPNEEIYFYLCVANGDTAEIQKNCDEGHFQAKDEGMGVLSKDPVVNLKYHFVVMIALVTRVCIEAGMETEYGFRLSDFYIQQLDGISTEQGVIALHDYAAMDYTRKMRLLRHDFSTSKPITECLDYIYSHIKERITIEDLANHLDLSKSYLSRLFKKEVGMPVSDYVREQKIERAKNLLRNSEFTLIEIANHLAFSSQSHFIQVFKQTTGMTPKAFRNEFFRTHWKVQSETGRYEAAGLRNATQKEGKV